MNLVVVAGSSDLADRYTRVVDEVAAAIPSRAIVVALEAETIESGLTGTVIKVGPPDEAYVGSERVRLTASGQVVDRVASAVESLCVPEVPTTLVWLGRVHLDDPVFGSLMREVQRVILDTDYTSLTSLVALAKMTGGATERGAGRSGLDATGDLAGAVRALLRRAGADGDGARGDRADGDAGFRAGCAPGERGGAPHRLAGDASRVDLGTDGRAAPLQAQGRRRREGESSPA